MAQSSFQQSIAAVAQAPSQFFHNAKANGLSKRNSIFSRPAARSSVELDRPELDPRTTNRSVSSCQAAPRPSTSSGVMERSQTDPTNAKRNSLFGSRKKSFRFTSRSSEASEKEDVPKLLRSDDECQGSAKKQTISTPFNFQHLSHTRRRHAPNLASVDENGMTRALHDVQTDILSSPSDAAGTPRGSTSSRPITPCLPAPGPARQHSNSRSVDVTQGRQAIIDAGNTRPRAASCQTRNVPSRNPSMSQVVRLSMNNPNIPDSSEIIPPVTAQTKHKTPSEVRYRSQQPLPALPQQGNSRRDSKRMTQDSQLSTSTSGEAKSPPTSQSSPKLGRSSSAGLWATRDGRGSTGGLSEASWEEDVDFCYKQEAESTCDFNWDENDEDLDTKLQLSAFTPLNDGSRNSALFASTPTSTSPLQRRRSSVVGHRGFLHSRKTSVIHETPDHEADEREGLEQFGPVSEDSKPIFGPEIMHLGTSVGSISDGASTHTGSSGHRKSNSCASTESSTRPAPPGSDNGHSSVASLNSVPELVHSNTPSSSSDAVAVQTPDSLFPKQVRPTPSCDIMRKPSTLSNRAILQAGRVVQRGRGNPSATGRMSRMSSAQPQKPVAEDEEPTTWI